MAPSAVQPRLPGRPKLRAKIDGRRGTSGAPSPLPALYSARNLDMCTRQLGHWNPFASPAAASPENSFGCSYDVPAEDGKPQELREEDESERLPITTGENDALNHGGKVVSELVFFGALKCGGEGSHQILSPGFQNLATCEYASSVHQISQSRVENALPALGETWINCATIAGIEKDSSGAPLHDSTLDYQPLPQFEFGKTGEYGRLASSAHSGLSVQGRRIQSWSKRRKQLSHALVRGLWRWKDGFHARKRMKRSGAGACNSGSDKSSDRAPYGVHASDPSTAPTSKAGPFKWSDFPITPTDSSGELFYCGGGNGNTLLPELNSLAKEWTACGCPRGDGTTTCADSYHCWLGNENNSAGSGYGSEPGYRGDEELEFGDVDEQDEEEKEPEHLRIWREVMASHGGPQIQTLENDPSIIQEYMLELLYGRGAHSQRSPQKGRRRRPSMQSILPQY